MKDTTCRISNPNVLNQQSQHVETADSTRCLFRFNVSRFKGSPERTRFVRISDIFSDKRFLFSHFMLTFALTKYHAELTNSKRKEESDVDDETCFSDLPDPALLRDK